MLKGIDFPAEKEDLVEHARDNGADPEIVEMLQEMPEAEFELDVRRDERLWRRMRSGEQAGTLEIPAVDHDPNSAGLAGTVRAQRRNRRHR